MQVIETQVFKYSELSDAAKKKAREWYANASAGDNYFAEAIIEDAKQCAAIMGIVIDDVQWSGFWSQGDGFAFSGRYTYQPGAVKAIKAHAPKTEALHTIAQQLQDQQRRFFYKLVVDVEMGRGNNIRVNVEHSENRYQDVSVTEREIDDAMISFCAWVYGNLESEYEYQFSGEGLTETMEVNEYTFTEEGHFFG